MPRRFLPKQTFSRPERFFSARICPGGASRLCRIFGDEALRRAGNDRQLRHRKGLSFTRRNRHQATSKLERIVIERRHWLGRWVGCFLEARRKQETARFEV